MLYNSLLNIRVSQSVSQSSIYMQFYNEINHTEPLTEIKRLKNMAEASQSEMMAYSDGWSQYCIPSTFLKRIFE